jgi:hypothetical protein
MVKDLKVMLRKGKEEEVKKQRRWERMQKKYGE